MREETPGPDVRALLTGRERRDVSSCWRPRGTPTALLIHTRAGSAVLRTDREHPMRPGDTVAWAPGAPQDFGCRPEREPWEIVWAQFRPRDGWHEWMRWPIVGAGVVRIAAPPARLRERIDAALCEMDGLAHSTLPRATDLALNALERALLWLDASNPGPQRLDDRVQEAVLFVGRHLDRPLSVAAIADAVHLSVSRLAHQPASSSCAGSNARRACSSRRRCRSARSPMRPDSAASTTSPAASRPWWGSRRATGVAGSRPKAGLMPVLSTQHQPHDADRDHRTLPSGTSDRQSGHSAETRRTEVGNLPTARLVAGRGTRAASMGLLP